VPSFYEQTETKIVTETIVNKEDDTGWRPIFAGRTKQDLSSLTQEKMHKMARYLYLTNPIARTIIDLKTAFTVGGGVMFQAEDAGVDEVLRRFWDDPVTAWDIRLSTRVRDLALDGELFMPVVVNPHTGFVRTGFINPLDVEDIYVDANNVEKLTIVKLKSDMSKRSSKSLKLKVINYDDKKERLDGEIFVFGINRSADSPRGISDLLSIIDWLGLYDQLLFNALERTSHMNAWYWDVLLEDFTEDQINDWLNKQQGQSLKAGSIRAHNQKVKWDVVAPELAATELRDAARTFKLQIISGAGLPESFFGEASESRASLSESQESAFKLLQERQRYIKYMISYMFDFAISKAIECGKLKKNVNRAYTITMPKISIRDMQRGGGAVFRFSQALDIGVKQHWLDPEDAEKIFSDVLGVMGFGWRSRPTKTKEDTKWTSSKQ